MLLSVAAAYELAVVVFAVVVVVVGHFPSAGKTGRSLPSFLGEKGGGGEGKKFSMPGSSVCCSEWSFTLTALI